MRLISIFRVAFVLLVTLSVSPFLLQSANARTYFWRPQAAEPQAKPQAKPQAPEPQAKPQAPEPTKGQSRQDHMPRNQQPIPPSRTKSKLPVSGTAGIPVFPDPPPPSVAKDESLQREYKEALASYYSAIVSQNQSAEEATGSTYSAAALENESAWQTQEHNSRVSEDRFENRKALFQWQRFSGRVIFFVAIFLVIAGVAFSGLQFYSALRKPPRVSDSTEGEISPTALEASIYGLKINSSILAVIALFISFLFFYLYLVHVFPITLVSE